MRLQRVESTERRGAGAKDAHAERLKLLLEMQNAEGVKRRATGMI